MIGSYIHICSFGYDFFFLFSQIIYFGISTTGIPHFFTV